MAKKNATPVPSKRTITRLIALTGVSPMYSIRTSGFGGLPYGIDLDNAATGFAIVRALRERAAVHPEMFPEDWREQPVPR